MKIACLLEVEEASFSKIIFAANVVVPYTRAIDCLYRAPCPWYFIHPTIMKTQMQKQQLQQQHFRWIKLYVLRVSVDFPSLELKLNLCRKSQFTSIAVAILQNVNIGLRKRRKSNLGKSSETHCTYTTTQVIHFSTHALKALEKYPDPGITTLWLNLLILSGQQVFYEHTLCEQCKYGDNINIILNS